MQMKMKAFLILEDGTVFEGIHIGAEKEIISEIVFNTSMAGYLEVLTDPSYAGQAVCMTYPLIGNYGVCKEDCESRRPWPDGFIVRELSRMPSNFRSDCTIQEYLESFGVPGIAGIDTYQDPERKRNHERDDNHQCGLQPGGNPSPPRSIYHRECCGKGDL